MLPSCEDAVERGCQPVSEQASGIFYGELPGNWVKYHMLPACENTVERGCQPVFEQASGMFYGKPPGNWVKYHMLPACENNVVGIASEQAGSMWYY